MPNGKENNGAPPAHAKPLSIHNKLLNSLRTPDRMPSPQPTHLGVPGQHNKVLHESGSGYVAPTFEGKTEQMEK
jgi:glutamate dehydrogenase